MGSPSLKITERKPLAGHKSGKRFFFSERVNRGVSLGLIALLALPVAAQTQLDPALFAQRIYEPQRATAALELSNGMCLVFGAMRADNYDVPGLAAYGPNGQIDAQFLANLGAGTWTGIRGAVEGLNGQALGCRCAAHHGLAA